MREERTLTDEQRLVEKLRKIETLFARTSSHGERIAAAQAADRVQKRLDEVRETKPIEFKFSLPDTWSKMLLLALLRREGLRPIRYPRQRRTTVVVWAPARLIDEDIWPKFEKMHDILHEHLADVTRRVVATAIEGDVSEPDIVTKSPGGGGANGRPAELPLDLPLDLPLGPEKPVE